MYTIDVLVAYVHHVGVLMADVHCVGVLMADVQYRCTDSRCTLC